MKRIIGTVLLLAASPLFAADVHDPCSAYMQLGAVYEVRALMMNPRTSTYEVDDSPPGLTVPVTVAEDPLRVACVGADAHNSGPRTNQNRNPGGSRYS